MMKDSKIRLDTSAMLEGLYNILKNDGMIPLSEVSKSKAQQKFMGMVHAAQTGKKPASKQVAKVAKSMNKQDVTDFAKTKHAGLPAKVAETSSDPIADESLAMFARKQGSRGTRHDLNNPWNQLKKSGRKFKSRIRANESDMPECAGVGKITAQNSTVDVNSRTPKKNLDAFNLESAMQDMHNTMVREGKLRVATQRAIPNLQVWKDLDNNNSTYAGYRYGVALAGAPADNMDKRGPVGGRMVTIGYTDADVEIQRKAAIAMGVTPAKHGSNKSEELPDVNTKSAVATFKKNKYGV